MLLLFAAEGYMDYREERARDSQRQLAVARSMAATVERELSAALAGLQALALSPLLQVADVEGFHHLATRFEATQPEHSTLLLLDRAGQQLVNTHVPPGGRLRRRDQTTAAEAAREIFGRGQPYISNLFPRALDHSLIVTADVPVVRDGQVIYDLSLVLPAQRFVAIIEGQHLAPDTVSAVFDRHGVIVARSPDPRHFVGQPASPGLLSVMLTKPDGVISVVSREGIPSLVAFSRSEPSGWSVAIAVPEATLRAPLRHSLRLLFGAGLVGLALSLGVAYALARRVVVPMRALARLAADPSNDRAPDAFGVTEIDAVANALRHSVAERQAAMDQLRTLNEGLEARVRHEINRREQAMALLAQSQRMEALGQLAGGIAHDFNNVLQAVTGGLSLIERRANDPEAVHRLAVMAADAAGRGAAVTRRLLTFARRGELQAVAVDSHELMESLREMLGPVLGANIRLTVDAPDALPKLWADRAQLETVLVNLAVNARDAMPEGGTIALSARVDQAGAGGFQPPNLSAGNYIRLTMTDTGLGMDGATLERAAEPFFTTKGPGQGTGLGLSMARGFAEQSGGGLCIHSAPGAGTTVAAWFPQASADQACCPATPPRAGTALAGEFRLLLVDDDSMVCELLAQDMRDRGFSVTTASDGLSALALLDDGEPADLLVTDFAMPGMNGLALIGEVRRRRPGLPAFLLTGYAETEVGLAVIDDRLTVLLRKPVSGADLAAHAAALRQPEMALV